jgi:acyl dehydratase
MPTASSSTWSYTPKDVILYALSVGATAEDLHLVYEHASDFRALPTFATLCWEPFAVTDVPGDIPIQRMLHGEHTLELFGDLPVHTDKIQVSTKIGNVYQAGKHAVIEIISEASLDGELLVRNTGRGIVPNFQTEAPARPKQEPIVVPSIVPHLSYKQVVPRSQAALYRLNGDGNPIHIDPKAAKAARLEQPILHGLCTLGYAVRSVLRHLRAFAKVHDPVAKVAKISRVDVRFLKPVLPGQGITTRVWTTGPDSIVFEVVVHEPIPEGTGPPPPRPGLNPAPPTAPTEPVRVLAGTMVFTSNVALAPPRPRL